MTNSTVFDPRDPTFRAAPHETYGRLLREHGTVMEQDGVAVLLGHDVVRRSFTARDVGRVPEVSLQQFAEGDFRQHCANTIAFMDPPEHTRVRSAFKHAFTPRALARLARDVEAAADEVFENFPRTGADLVSDIAEPLPLNVICAMLGVPREERDLFRRCSRNIGLALEPSASDEIMNNADQAAVDFYACLDRHARLQGASADGSVLQTLVAAQQDGTISWAEAINQAIFVLNAGHDTTANLISNMSVHLLRNRALLDELNADSSLIDGAVEEFLRMYPSLHFTIRIPIEEFHADADHVIAPNQIMFVVVGAANRDPSVFPNPDEFDPRRANAKAHVSFAAGIHVCVGAALARIEARAALQRLLPLLANFELDGDPEPNVAIAFQGFSSIRVRPRTNSL